MQLRDSNNSRLLTFKWIDCLALAQYRQRLGIIKLIVSVNVLEVLTQGPEGEVRVTYPRLGAVRRPADNIN